MMKTNTFSISRLAARYRRDESGVAAIEFAFIAPLLVVFLLGTTTATQSLWANGKVAQTTSVIGDLISQENQLDNTSFKAITDAGQILLEPFPTGDMKIMVTASIACYDDPTDTEGKRPEIKVVWSNAWSDNQLVAGPQTPGDLLTDAPQELSIEHGDYLIRTVVAYTYEPTITRQAGYTIEMEETAYHQPRDNKPIAYPQQEGTNPTDCS